MKQIGIFSDTHGFLNPNLYKFFEHCDELWHAGDWGDVATFDKVEQFKPLKTVWGNIDGTDLRVRMPEILIFEEQGLTVCMLHIGGYPLKYSPKFKQIVQKQKIDIMICGHSHILKVIRDKEYNLLHINPGAAGNHGFHKVCTAVRLKIEGGKLFDLEVWEQTKKF
ncbi:MAG: metallophosphoesterase family protein [Bacteroidota bacterium]